MGLTKISTGGVKDDTADEAKLKVSNAGSNGDFLQKQSGNTGGLTWAAVVPATITVADESTDTSCNVLYTTAATGDLAPKTGTNLTFNSSSGALTATSFVGDLTGDVTGNAATATNASGLTGSPNITVGTIGCGAITGTSTVSDSIGNVRTLGYNVTTGTPTLAATDAGKYVYANGNVTIPASTFSIGQMVSIVNYSGSNITIVGTAITLYNTADAATGNRTLATRGMATILFHSSSEAYISGSGLS